MLFSCLFKNQNMKTDMVAQACNHRILEAEAKWLLSFWGHLSYILSSGPAWATEGDTVKQITQRTLNRNSLRQESTNCITLITSGNFHMSFMPSIFISYLCIHKWHFCIFRGWVQCEGLSHVHTRQNEHGWVLSFVTLNFYCFLLTNTMISLSYTFWGVWCLPLTIFTVLCHKTPEPNSHQQFHICLSPLSLHPVW